MAAFVSDELMDVSIMCLSQMGLGEPKFKKWIAFFSWSGEKDGND